MLGPVVGLEADRQLVLLVDVELDLVEEEVGVRLGVGRPDDNAIEHVLGRFTEDEQERAEALVGLAVEAVVTGLVEGLDTAMNRYNGKSV